jgi:competence protein ComEA
MGSRTGWARGMGMVLALITGAAWAGSPRTSGKQSVTGFVNLNTATAGQLDQLPGVGEKAAKRILEFRQKKPFARIEELVKVKGFGKKKFDRLKPHLAVSGPTTLALAKGGRPETNPSLEGRESVQGRGGPPRR